MKFLQIIKNEKTITLKLLVMGIDYDQIYDKILWRNDRFIANISDCYNQRPLIEIDGFCEFDLVELKTHNLKKTWYFNFIKPFGWESPKYSTLPNGEKLELDQYNSYNKILYYNNDKERYINLGFIFLAKNKTKDIELYKQALEITNN